MNFPQENKVFQRPCRIVLLPSYFLATTVVNQYDRSIFNMVGSLGKWFRRGPLRVGHGIPSSTAGICEARACLERLALMLGASLPLGSCGPGKSPASGKSPQSGNQVAPGQTWPNHCGSPTPEARGDEILQFQPQDME